MEPGFCHYFALYFFAFCRRPSPLSAPAVIPSLPPRAKPFTLPPRFIMPGGFGGSPGGPPGGSPGGPPAIGGGAGGGGMGPPGSAPGTPGEDLSPGATFTIL